jgi:hypothetical protein
MEITITRESFRNPGNGYRNFMYYYTPSEGLTGSLGHVYPAGIRIEYGTGLTSLRSMLRLTQPQAAIKESF